MARKRTPAAGAGWIVSFADLMSLLVTFFVLIISFSIQDTVKLQVVAGSMREAFGVARERKFAGVIELDGLPERRWAKNVEQIERPISIDSEYAQADKGDTARSGESAARDVSASAIEQARLHRVRADFENALLADPFLQEVAEQVTIEINDEGLSVVMIDQTGRAMFPAGSPTPSARARRMIASFADAAADLPNSLAIDAHGAEGETSADGAIFRLTSERADGVRKLLQEEGLAASRFSRIAGYGASDPLFPDDPHQAGNRRVSITLMRAEPVLPADLEL